MARNMDEKQPLLKNENQSQIDIESGGNESNLLEFRLRLIALSIAMIRSLICVA